MIVGVVRVVRKRKEVKLYLCTVRTGGGED
jgi:hypothetical protein